MLHSSRYSTLSQSFPDPILISHFPSFPSSFLLLLFSGLFYWFIQTISYHLLQKITIFYNFLLNPNESFISCIDMLSRRSFRCYLLSGSAVFCHKHNVGFSASLILNQGETVLQSVTVNRHNLWFALSCTLFASVWRVFFP